MTRSVFLLLAMSFTPAWAEPATVLVESLSIPVAGVTVMDYVAPGTTIDLGGSGVIVLDHLATCTQEIATGGVLRVGAEESQTNGGNITRTQMECDGRVLQLSASMAKGGGQVYRAIGRSLLLHSTAPMILAGKDGTVMIQRLDQPDPPISLQARGGASGAIDMAAQRQELVAGGTYRITLGQNSVTFRIDPAAKGREAPLLARLLPV
jgi:hypothetical protein